MGRTYATPEAFRMALEQRLRTEARKQQRDLTRLRQLLVFDRFLVRVFHHLGDKVIAKGGITLELRLERARTAKDVDLWMKGDAAGTLGRLRKLSQLDLGDFLSFNVEPDKDHPVMKGEGMVYEGQRFRCEARLAGKLYGGRFGIDVGFADALTVEPDLIDRSPFLGVVRSPTWAKHVITQVVGATVAVGAVAWAASQARRDWRMKRIPLVSRPFGARLFAVVVVALALLALTLACLVSFRLFPVGHPVAFIGLLTWMAAALIGSSMKPLLVWVAPSIARPESPR